MKATSSSRSTFVPVFVMACATLGATSADAAEKPAFGAFWVIEPLPVEKTQMVVRPGDVITHARLVPMGGLMTLEGDALAATGELAAPSGTQLMRLRSSAISACTFSFPQSKQLLKRLFSDQNFTCFVDEDKDGKFESAFTAMSTKIGVPPPLGTIPNKRIPIQPVAYKLRNISEGTDYPRLVFKYSHQDKITGHAYLGVCIANFAVKKDTCFDTYYGVKSTKLPLDVNVAGNAIVVTAKDGAVLTLTVNHGFNPMPFIAQET